MQSRNQAGVSPDNKSLLSMDFAMEEADDFGRDKSIGTGRNKTPDEKIEPINDSFVNLKKDKENLTTVKTKHKP